MEIIKSLIFGFVEGIAEWLPISSTGHLILLNEFLKLDGVSKQFLSMFDVVMQLGAIMAVVVLFWNRLWPFTKKHKKIVFKEGSINMWFKIIIACIPAAIIGVLFDEKIEELFYNPISVSIALISVGVIFIIVEELISKKKFKTNSIEKISFKQAFIIGIFQLIAAVFPGTSRSGATILGGLMLGLSRETAAEFTFFLAVPVMFGASLLKAFKYVKFLITSSTIISGVEIGILVVASLTAFITSLIVIKLLLNYIDKHDFKAFGWYRIALGIIVLLHFLVWK